MISGGGQEVEGLRLLRSSDKPLLHDFFKSGLGCRERRFFMPHPLVKPVAYLRYQLLLNGQESGTATYHVVEKGGVMLAIVFLRNIADKQAELGVGVRNEYQGMGYGKRLVGFIMKKASELGLERVTLTCHPLNKRALSFYGKNGFEKVGVKWVFVGHLGFRREVVMERKL